MAKQVYKIPADLASSYADMEIAIQSKDGLGVKPMPIKVILTYIGSVIMCFYVCTRSVIATASVGLQVLFVILWIAMTFLLARYDGTKRMQIQAIPTLLAYIPKRARRVITRASAPANDFYLIAGIESIDKDSGLVKYIDDTYAYWYRVVGSASILLFDDDRTAILDRADAFYRKIGTDCECLFLTTKSSQTVYRQVANLKKLYDNLEVKDPDLKMLANEQFDVLKNYVGGSFRSIHQYMILKGDNREALTRLKNVVRAEAENSTLMLKQCVPLYYDDIIDVLQIIYRGRKQ